MFTSEHEIFLKLHGFVPPEEHVVFAPYMTNQEIRTLLQSANRLFAIVAKKCKNGHTLRMAGGCPQCNPAIIAFARRTDKPGFVYVARSASTRYIKIGSSSEPFDRIRIANLEGYGGVRDWQMRFVFHADRMGRTENLAHSYLKEFAVSKIWIRNGRETMTKEIFKCSLKAASEAVDKALAFQGSGA
jgi:hypothetical protein